VTFKKQREQPPKKNSAGRAAIGRSRSQMLQTIRDSFEGDVPRVRRTFGYRLSIAVVTFTLLFLTVIYLLLIAGVGYCLWWNGTHNLAPIASSDSYGTVLLYGLPEIVGMILFFFMIKPLFAPPPRAGAEFVLKPDREEVLYAFVDRIAEAVGAPVPKRITVDCEVNASAGLGWGPGGFFGNELTLTLGLPLFAGLSTRQLSGVIAHELGHFTQGAGMRASYVVRSINHWFARVVYERDGWDETLFRTCRERIAPILVLAALFVGLTRGVLWVLMAVGHVLSCFLTRQMEYDADRCMARVAGFETFEEIARRLAIWEASSQVTLSAAPRWWRNARFPDDLPSLIMSTSQRIPKKVHREIQKDLNKSRTGLFDTHPCLKDRMANVAREATDGVFRLDEPATVLLDDYSKLAMEATLSLHRAVFGRHVRRDQLVRVVDLEDSV
jgi:Zn-dependent protease with chaperone function